MFISIFAPTDLALRWVCRFAPTGGRTVPRDLSDGLYFISAVDAVLDELGDWQNQRRRHERLGVGSGLTG